VADSLMLRKPYRLVELGEMVARAGMREMVPQA
jgi:hypothetical protein